mmetsp:Transcript_11774/g.37470  ORF Transcript_11774/g.37470 Transcript_11774/m.37470 type:complete len:150 (-) Transcript_11774:137-586(-)
MCRAEAQRVYARKGELEAAGVRLQAIVKEEIGSEVSEFREGFWPEAPIFMNPGLEWYSALHGGSQKKSSIASFLAKVLNPFSQLNKNLKRSKGVEGNMVGEGFIHGGVFVVRRGAPRGEAAVFAHAEAELGDGPPSDALVAAAKKAASA